MNLIILDAGHGIETFGKRSPEIPPGIREYAFNRDVVRRIARALESMDIPSHVICQDEHAMPIRERKAIARTMISEWEGNAIFISVHANAAGPGGWYEKARGVRVFTRMNPKPPSQRLADLMTDHISALSGLRGLTTKDHIVRKGKKVRLGILTGLPCPAVLTESGFMTSRRDCEILASREGRIAIANGHVNAILDFQGATGGLEC